MIYRIPMNAKGSTLRFKLHFFMLLLRNKTYYVEINDETVEQLIDGYSKNQAARAEAAKKLTEIPGYVPPLTPDQIKILNAIESISDH